MHVLLVENEHLEQKASLFSNLETAGYQVFLAHTPSRAAKQLLTDWPNLIIFNCPDGHLNLAGFQQALIETAVELPCILIGQNDLFQPQFNDKTLRISPDRLEQLGQTIQKITAAQKNRFLRLPHLIIDNHRRRALRNGHPYSFTPKEFKLLKLLLENREQVLERKTIMQKVWETDYMGDTRTLDVHIRWLREKLEENPSRPRHLITMRGVGYRFIVDPSPE